MPPAPHATAAQGDAARLPRPPEGFGRQNCPVEQTLALLSGKWRLMVLFRLGQGTMRFNALARSLSPISQRVLATTLRGLEDDSLIWRKVHETVPPHVDYGLTARGAALAPVFEAMAAWRLGAGDDTPK